jgi:hypothetical protein
MGVREFGSGGGRLPLSIGRGRQITPPTDPGRAVDDLFSPVHYPTTARAGTRADRTDELTADGGTVIGDR